jgi:uncharacterized protein YrrD
MIRATELGGRAVVDIEAAEKLGKIDRVVLDPEAKCVAGFVVSRGSSMFNSGDHLMLPAACVHAIGPDAVTVNRGAPVPADEPSLVGLPRVSDMVGRKVVSDEGRLLGTVDDVLIDETDGRIVGYALRDVGDLFKNLIPKDRDGHRNAPYLRADAKLHAGKDLIVAPEDAVSVDYDVMNVSASTTPGRWRRPAGITNTTSTWLREEAEDIEGIKIKTEA